MPSTPGTEMKTADLFEAAFAVTRGLTVARIDVRPPKAGGQHPRVTFVFDGDHAADVSRTYRDGRAEANLAIFKSVLEALRRRMWAAIKEETGYTSAR